MTGAAATQRKERSEASTVEARREAPEAGPPGSRDQVAVNGAGFEEEAAKFVRPPAVSRTRPDPRAQSGTRGGQTEDEAALLGEYNLYNG